ncbi:aspartate aminotransferase family protein [Salinarimonas rosea]|uniref:aspartate aminotransferase family protein n=1 Tax=Salinarimonas rosea TaxID=552063 RepID=UPI0004225A90|nr:aspartate aminotransferase family protein [Salinarimonas rosea]
MSTTDRRDPTTATGGPDGDRRLIARRRALLGPAYRLFYSEPVHVVRGEGVWLYDPDGNRYLDAYNNVACVGHSHPRVVDAIARQAAVLNTHTRYLHETVLDYAERLLGHFPRALGHVMFTCTGSEANDLALRAARVFTGGTGFVVTENAYHGVTLALAGMSPSLGMQQLSRDVRVVPAPFRDDTGARFAGDVAVAVEDLAAAGVRPAGLIVDTIFSSDGVIPDPRGFLRPAVETIRRAGGLFIADEVQPGFGRTGTHMWGFERHEIVPDIVTLGKPMGNGHPVAGLVAKPEVLAAFGEQMRYFNTFGGNPVSCAAGLAVLDIIAEERLLGRVEATGRVLRAGLEEIAARRGGLGEIRAAGLFVGVDVTADAGGRAPERAAHIVDALRRRRVLVGAAGRDGSVLKIRPPLVFDEEHAGRLLEALDGVLSEMPG